MDLRTLQPASISLLARGFAADRWVNTPPLRPDDLSGRVVLVDFWEYTCINWIRTSPYVKAWHRTYAPAGLTVIGAHAPEFEFGELAGNIDRGIRDHGLTYPVAIDNDYLIWRAVGNNAWPAKYLFDGHGKLVDRWVGEGAYDEIEAEIRRLLIDARPEDPLPEATPEGAAFVRASQPSSWGITLETYVGAERGEPGSFTLRGDWRSHRQYLELHHGTGELILPFTAGEVNLVVQPGESGHGAISVLLDGEPVESARGADVDPDGVARFDFSGMIRLIAGASPGDHVLTLVCTDPGVRVYVFTFGP